MSAEPTEVENTSGDLPQNAKNMAMLCHMIALVGLLGNGIGFILGPIIVWLVKKDEHPFIDDQGKEAVNWQITMFIVGVVCFILCFVFIGFLLLPILLLVNIIFPIIAGLKASNGETYRYPFAIRFLK